MKKGKIDNKSMMFIPSLRNGSFLGAAANLKTYSTMNHKMQTTSNFARVGLSENLKKWRILTCMKSSSYTYLPALFPSSSNKYIPGTEFKIIPIVEAIMKEMEIKVLTLAAMDISDPSMKFWNQNISIIG